MQDNLYALLYPLHKDGNALAILNVCVVLSFRLI